MGNISEIKKFLLNLSDEEIMMLLSNKNSMRKTRANNKSDNSKCWMDQPIYGLSKEGLSHLKELEHQLNDINTAHHVDKKQLRYLRELKTMKMDVPEFFRETINPKQFYQRLKTFCSKNDIPDEIVSRVVPALVTYIITGHMRAMLFVGNKGCGKTTAVRLLVEEALQLHTEIIKVPQSDYGCGLTGISGHYQSADAGCIAKARFRSKSLINAYLFDEIDKVTHNGTQASVDDQLLSLTDESNSDIYDNYLETSLVGLEHCPIFFTANDLQKVNPILADRCMVIHFPDANASRIKSISKKYADSILTSSLYSMIDFNYDLLDKHIDHLVDCNITSLRKHQQLIEAVLGNALDVAFEQSGNCPVSVTEDMFKLAEESILDTSKQKVGFVA